VPILPRAGDQAPVQPVQASAVRPARRGLPGRVVSAEPDDGHVRVAYLARPRASGPAPPNPPVRLPASMQEPWFHLSPTRAQNKDVDDSHSPDDQASDAARWWRSYVLADNDQVDKLRSLAAAGDDHARRHLASWLSDRGRTGDAIDVIRPLADAGDEVAELWLAGWLADGDYHDELRQRAVRGSWHAERELAKLLARHDLYDELQERASVGGSDHALYELAKRLAERDLHDPLRELAVAADPERRLLILEAAREGASGSLDVLRVLAELGDEKGRARLAHRLARKGHLDELRHRAESGDEYAQHWLNVAPS
jgi:hypothetical protein